MICLFCDSVNLSSHVSTQNREVHVVISIDLKALSDKQWLMLVTLRSAKAFG